MQYVLSNIADSSYANLNINLLLASSIEVGYIVFRSSSWKLTIIELTLDCDIELDKLFTKALLKRFDWAVTEDKNYNF